MRSRGSDRGDDGHDERREPRGRGYRWGRGRPEEAPREPEVSGEELGWIADLRTAKERRGAIGPDDADPAARPERLPGAPEPGRGLSGTGIPEPAPWPRPAAERRPPDEPTPPFGARPRPGTGHQPRPGSASTDPAAPRAAGVGPEERPGGRHLAPSTPTPGRSGGRHSAPEPADDFVVPASGNAPPVPGSATPRGAGDPLAPGGAPRPGVRPGSAVPPHTVPGGPPLRPTGSSPAVDDTGAGFGVGGREAGPAPRASVPAPGRPAAGGTGELARPGPRHGGGRHHATGEDENTSPGWPPRLRRGVEPSPAGRPSGPAAAGGRHSGAVPVVPGSPGESASRPSDTRSDVPPAAGTPRAGAAPVPPASRLAGPRAPGFPPGAAPATPGGPAGAPPAPGRGTPPDRGAMPDRPRPVPGQPTGRPGSPGRPSDEPRPPQGGSAPAVARAAARPAPSDRMDDPPSETSARVPAAPPGGPGQPDPPPADSGLSTGAIRPAGVEPRTDGGQPTHGSEVSDRPDTASGEREPVRGGRTEHRRLLREERRLRTIALLLAGLLVLGAAPAYLGLRAATRDPVFTALDALAVPAWAKRDVVDGVSGSRWCLLECRFRERTIESERSWQETAQIYESALTREGWQPWKVALCPERPVENQHYSCWRRDELTLDLWVRPPTCSLELPDQPAVPPTTDPESGGDGASDGEGCQGSVVSIKVRNAIADDRTGPRPSTNPSLTGVEPDPLLTDPLGDLLPTPTSS